MGSCLMCQLRLVSTAMVRTFLMVKVLGYAPVQAGFLLDLRTAVPGQPVREIQLVAVFLPQVGQLVLSQIQDSDSDGYPK